MSRAPKSLIALLLTCMFTPLVYAHGPAYGPGTSAASSRTIVFPNTEKHLTLSLDLHTHTVFSDGHVWPTVRVGEAQRDGLDGYAVTEHLEYQPHISDIPHTDRNRSFEEASRAAANSDLTVIPGVEITRLGDPGHINAVFITDANPLVAQRQSHTLLPEHMFATEQEARDFAAGTSELFRGAHTIEIDGQTKWMPYSDQATYLAINNFAHASTRDAREVLEAANEQGAFVFWNHPTFASVKAPLNEFHAAAQKDGLLHGVEIANGDRYYENAHRLALKHNLALIGVSDVHELIAWDYRPDAGTGAGHRPVTLVLAEEDSLTGMRDALFARRSIVWWKDKLIGRSGDLAQLLAAIVTIDEVKETAGGLILTLRNRSSAPIELVNRSGMKLTHHANTIHLAPLSNTLLEVQMDKVRTNVDLKFSVSNALVAPGEAATLTLNPSKAE